jgi:hypothetical protein
MTMLNQQGAPVDRLLSRLEGVRETSTGQHMAQCPAHDDKSPSLAIRDVGDSVLIHCFAGCDAESIMAAVDLTLADLFAGDDHHYQHGGHHNGGALPIRERWNARAMLRELSDESVVVLIAAADMLQNRPLPPDDYKRLCTAVDRISRIVEISA